MRAQLLALLGLFATSAIASRSESQLRLLDHLKKNVNDAHKLHDHAKAKQAPSVAARADSRSGSSPSPHSFLNEKTKRFAVDGKKIPEFNGDAGESYAGQLPISDKKDEKNKHFFWFFPSDNEEYRKKKEITIWLNGGPGCSSLMGLLKENGPFVWPPGTMKPVSNPWSFHRLTNTVWIDQPVSVGFSTGKPTIRNEDELAEQFMGFWKNFMETFSMQGYKVFIVGESYGGYYASYISSHFVNAKDTKYFGLGGLMVVDGASFGNDVQSEVVAAAYVEQNYNLFVFDDTSMENMREAARTCGYEDYLKKYYTYPPSGPQPAVLPWTEKLANGNIRFKSGCGHLWEDIVSQAVVGNPCFNIYNIRDYCPVPFDPLSASPYFDREDVKRAIHAPLDVKWSMCVDTAFVGKGDESEPPSKYELPNVIDKTQNVIYAQGGMDFILPASGVLLGVQNMTWGGKMGFQSRPTDPFYVPCWGLGELNGTFYGSDLPAMSGVAGTTHTERGFTVVVTELAGHEGPEYAPTASLRQLEKLLGRVRSLSDTEPFTLPQLAKIQQFKKPLGKGTYPIPWLPNSRLGK
ncbi:hypothetical protein C2857_002409 [Epichloe festucae Fl1]|uniref:Carboxypeptidase n=1 Tax=Epichloe festucae (strain Fl1) TaxID=877507 RepID=A0A7S9PRS2_EPIFF|nr:hypothetical protein C2857_002409 [Epichloe festucae Fl1]